MARPPRGIGTQNTTLRRPPGTRPTTLVAALQATDTEDESTPTPTGTLSLPLATIASHPDNPRESLGDLTGLAASITEFGILQPPIVIPAAAFLSAWPHHRPAITHEQWVIIAGHRRHAAATLAGLDEIPVLVRENLATPEAATKAFIIENVHRADLSPLEEARGYATLADLGLSQRQIATSTGVSQSNVSKRLSLLRLPQAVQDAITAGRLVIAEALALTAVEEPDQERVWRLSVEQDLPISLAAARVRQSDEADQRRRHAHERALAEQVALIDPAQTFGPAAARHELREVEDVERSRRDGTLVGAVDDRGLRYYTTEPVEPARDDVPAERLRAGEARLRACATLAQTPPATRDAVDDLCRLAAAGYPDHARAVELAHQWLADTYPEGSPRATAQTWLDTVFENRTTPVRIHVAWALSLARDELAVQGGGEGTPLHHRHIDRLTDRVGYQPTAWEHTTLTDPE